MTDKSDIDRRNQLRKLAKLPQLDVGSELLRLIKVEQRLRYDAFAKPLREKLWRVMIAERGKPKTWMQGMAWGAEIEKRIRLAYKRRPSLHMPRRSDVD